MKCYAGIGSRRPEGDFPQLAEESAHRLRELGWILRSGHAKGMDQAFEGGAYRDAQIFLPWPSYGMDGLDADYILDRPTTAAFRVAERFHPAWDRVRPNLRPLHARNAHIVLGTNLDDPVRFVICWTDGGTSRGGTGQSLRIARAYDIPIFNLWNAADRERVERLLHEPVAPPA